MVRRQGGDRVDFAFEGDAEFGLNIRRNVRRQLPNLRTLRTPAIDQHERLPVMNTMRAPVVPLPTRSINEPARSELECAIRQGVCRQVRMRREQLGVVGLRNNGVFEKTACIAQHSGIRKL